MGVKLWIFIGLVVFATFPRLVWADPEPGFRSKSFYDKQDAENDDPKGEGVELLDREHLLLNTNFEKDRYDFREVHEQEVTIIKIHTGQPHQEMIEGPPLPNIKSKPDEIYQAPCETFEDCTLIDSKGMECIDGRCECMMYQDKLLKYHEGMKKCLGDKGHICTHDFACHSRTCVKPLKGKRWAEGDFKGICEGEPGEPEEDEEKLFIMIVGALFTFWGCVVIGFIFTVCCLPPNSELE